MQQDVRPGNAHFEGKAKATPNVALYALREAGQA
jgi:hypothetical protein